MIELHGIIQFWENGHKHVEVVVNGESPDTHVTIPVGIDVKVNRGMILSFLAARFGVRSGDIVWPGYIRAENIKE